MFLNRLCFDFLKIFTYQSRNNTVKPPSESSQCVNQIKVQSTVEPE